MLNTPSPRVSSRTDHSRRDFLLSTGTLAAAAGAVSASANAEEPKLPRVKFGKYSVSRLVCGSNPFGALSHLSPMVDYEFRQYYTPEQVTQTLRKCQEEGINAAQGLGIPRYQALVKAGGNMQVFSNGSGNPSNIKNMIDNGGSIGIHHFGVTTDVLYKQGKLSQAREYLKAVRDAGVLVGLTTHIPEVVDVVESEGWDIDYFMLAVYQWGRTKEELEKMFGDKKDLLPVETYSNIAREGYSEVFLNGDPPKMYKRIKQTKKPCIAYKILAAGRRCQNPAAIEGAFKEAFENIKPSDVIIVGMYPRYIDQITENCGYVRRYGGPLNV